MAAACTAIRLRAAYDAGKIQGSRGGRTSLPTGAGAPYEASGRKTHFSLDEDEASDAQRTLSRTTKRPRDSRLHEIAKVSAAMNDGFSADFFKNENHHWLFGSFAFVVSINSAIILSVLKMGVDAQAPHSSFQDASVVFEHVLTAIFGLEMVVKLCMLRSYYFRQGLWNVFDFFVATTSILDLWIIPLLSNRASNFGIIRIFRLLRLLRVLRLVRNVPELMLVIEGMVASMRSMGWIVMLLSCFIYMFSIFFVEVVGGSGASVYPAFNDEYEELHDKELADFNNFLYFGSLFRAVNSMFSVVLMAEWGSIVRPVTAAQPWMCLIFGVLVFITSFGFFNVIIGVIVERTTDAVSRARADSEASRIEQRFQLSKDIANIIFDLDEDGNESLSYLEFKASEHNDTFRSLMAGLDLPHGFTLQDLFVMLDHDASQEISKDELVLGMLRLIKGTGFQHQCMTHLMLSQIKLQVKEARVEIQSKMATEFASLRMSLLYGSALQAPQSEGVPQAPPDLGSEPDAAASGSEISFGSHNWNGRQGLAMRAVLESMAPTSTCKPCFEVDEAPIDLEVVPETMTDMEDLHRANIYTTILQRAGDATTYKPVPILCSRSAPGAELAAFHGQTEKWGVFEA